MTSSEISKLLQEYQELSSAVAAVDYGNPASVRRSNRSADRLRAIARRANFLGPGAIAEFGSLLKVPLNDTNLWAAFHLIEVIDTPPELRRQALEVLKKRLADIDDLTSTGIRMQLNRLKEAGKLEDQ
jgi:hypothetical protein